MISNKRATKQVGIFLGCLQDNRSPGERNFTDQNQKSENSPTDGFWSFAPVDGPACVFRLNPEAWAQAPLLPREVVTDPLPPPSPKGPGFQRALSPPPTLPLSNPIYIGPSGVCASSFPPIPHAPGPASWSVLKAHLFPAKGSVTSNASHSPNQRRGFPFFGSGEGTAIRP